MATVYGPSVPRIIKQSRRQILFAMNFLFRFDARRDGRRRRSLSVHLYSAINHGGGQVRQSNFILGVESEGEGETNHSGVITDQFSPHNLESTQVRQENKKERERERDKLPDTGSEHFHEARQNTKSLFFGHSTMKMLSWFRINFVFDLLNSQ